MKLYISAAGECLHNVELVITEPLEVTKICLK